MGGHVGFTFRWPVSIPNKLRTGNWTVKGWNWRTRLRRGLKLTSKISLHARPSLASLFARANDRELAFQIWKLSSLVHPSELDFHIWNAKSQSLTRAKGEAKMAAHVGKFCASVPVLYTTLIFRHSFCLVRLPKHSQPWKKCTDEILLDQFYIFECLKGFIIAVWPKNYP